MLIKAYVDIARVSHWTKHIFILPGIVLALLITKAPISDLNATILVGFLSAGLIASANYVINEYLDAEFDRFHPLKSHRPGAAGELQLIWVITEYIILASIGLFAATTINTLFLITSIVFLFSGIIYNVRPFRTKDLAYLDVLSESLNNPIRLVLGWSMISSTTLPPLSIFIAYWFGGAFLMALKRLSEFRYISETLGNSGIHELKNYRASFQVYTHNSLLISSSIYQILSVFFAAVFLVKYRAEYILSFPFFAILFGYYFNLSLNKEAITQTPEKLYKDKGLILILLALSAILLLTTIVDIPIIRSLIESEYTVVNFEK